MQYACFPVVSFSKLSGFINTSAPERAQPRSHMVKIFLTPSKPELLALSGRPQTGLARGALAR